MNIPLDNATEPAAEASRPLRLLVVDDYPPGLLLLKQQFTFLGHQVVAATDGEAAFGEWLAHDFDVVLTDSRMPLMDGCGLSQAIRQEEAARARRPCLIIGFTANAVPEERERCLVAGMDECFFKPMNLVELDQYLRTRVGRAAAPVIVAPQVCIPDGLRGRLQQLAADDGAVLKKLVTTLRTTNQTDRASLQQLLESGCVDGLADFAHRIRGVAGLMGAERLVSCCQALEQACAGKVFTQTVGHEAQRLAQAMQELAADLDRLLHE